MKKVLHLFRTSQFTQRYIDMSNEFFNNQTFWIYGEQFLKYEDRTYLDQNNIEYIPQIMIKLNKKNVEEIIDEFDMIIYHGIFEIEIIKWFYLHKKLLKKLVIFIWGGDRELLGNWKERLLKKYILKHTAVIAAITWKDYEYIYKKYHVKGKYMQAMYGGNVDRLRIQQKKMENKKIINIQVGNSATQTNNHLRVFDELKKYRDENIRIYVPLSYGDIVYADEVIQYGEEIFGDKFIPVRNYMPLEEYYGLLSDMDIAIIDVEGRQQALNNTFALLKSGCKLYFRENSMLYYFFETEVKCKIYAIGSIRNMNFEQFCKDTYRDKEYNSMQVQSFNSTEKCAKLWRKIFEI